ncbi:hypothetical protein [Aequorivita echinoideorum]|uniref:Nucleotidyl transferase AbiEii toxin, Type IV TA system n=1 Tax=Aequorivita echinoideorum TaxID=1549647 RepID=A0ABS5S4V7_9FLAO|nr:hypothetical protein [Aequorivita echinoideorum]MBT0607407.1 hypothetical protein [Aequorivita echinoideorum]
MDNEEKIIQEKMRGLISRSCEFNTEPSQKYRDFHKQFLKFYFNVIDVNIDYSNSTILLSNSKPITADPIRLYDLNEAISEEVSYNNLEETLKGCLENGNLQHKFYKKMLFQFSTKTDDFEDAMSA